MRDQGHLILLVEVVGCSIHWHTTTATGSGSGEEDEKQIGRERGRIIGREVLYGHRNGLGVGWEFITRTFHGCENEQKERECIGGISYLAMHLRLERGYKHSEHKFGLFWPSVTNTGQ